MSPAQYPPQPPGPQHPGVGPQGPPTPYVQQGPPPPQKKQKRFGWGALILAFFIGLVIGILGGAGSNQDGSDSTDSQPTATVTQTVPAGAHSKAPKQTAKPAPKTYGPGTYVVGEDIEPGTYKAKADEDGACYWARLKKGSDVIDNDINDGQAVVTIKKTDWGFKTSGCTKWRRTGS